MIDYREAMVSDITEMHRVRIAVKENVLNTPGLVTNSDYELYITSGGKGWVCEADGRIVGFAIIDTGTNNVWALFVDPEFEKQGIGKSLQKMLLDWSFKRSDSSVWLTTGPGTRAESFYRKTGWRNLGIAANGEIKFEMTSDNFSILN